MGKIRRRVTTRGDHPNLTEAINAVRSGMMKRQAAREFCIPESTIRLRLKSDNADPVALGRKPTFSKKQEEELAGHVVKVANLFYGLTPVELRRIAYEFAEANKIPNNFSQTKKMAGKEWLALFLKRNSSISLRKPENTSINRICAFNKESVGVFFSNLEKVMGKHKFSESRIYNVDETGISNVQRPVRILGPKGQKQIGVAASGERGKTVTVACCVSASGNFVPPMFVFPRLRMSPHLQRGGPVGATYTCSKNGWINEDLFLTWLHHFAQVTKPTPADPVLLILDNHSSHISVNIYNFCRDTGIVLLSLPPHTSHRLQPLDLTFFGPLKTAFYRECSLLMKTKASQEQESQRKITQYELADLFNRAYLKVATMDKGISGFSAAGISPLNPDKFSEIDFESGGSEQVFEIQLTEEDAEQRGEERSTEVSTPTPGTSTCPDLLFQNHGEEQHTASHTVRVIDISPLPGPNKTKTASSNNATTNANTPKSRKQKSEILTGTPMKKKLEEAQRKKENNKRKKEMKAKGCSSKGTVKLIKSQKQKHVKRRIVASETESEAEDIDMNNLCDDDTDDDMHTQTDVCMICNEFGRDNEMWYRCVGCGKWSHEDCSGWDSPENYFCDLCLKMGKK